MFWRPYWTSGMEQVPSPRPLESPRRDDRFVDSYARWREASAAVRGAYEHWPSAEPRDRALAWSAYRAALDREQQAADAYQEYAERIAGRSG